MKSLKLVSVTIALMLVSTTMQAQFGKRLGEAAKNAAENATIRKTEQKTDEAVSKSIDKATDPNTYKGDKKDDEQKSSEEKKKPEVDGSTPASPTSPSSPSQNAKQEPTSPKLESFTQYDFVPGDQILFFEDFSQDAVGDFPDKWTTNGSGEVRTINIAPGKWYHPTVEDPSFNYMKTIAFPQNFIVEFDYISTVEGSGYYLTLYNEKGNKELNADLFPGDQGFTLYLGQREWNARGYKEGFDDDIQGRSEKNTIVGNSVNHVIVWVQNRRVRVYHLGAKVLDLPTVLHPNTTFNRLRFFGWDTYDMPFISNIKVTTAAPDMRSKLLTEGKIISYGINFDSGKDVIKPESYGAIKAIADVLKENPDVKVRIVGHTDTDGNAAANLDLSKRRAAAVKAFLAKEFGIDAARMETDGKGQTEPLAPNNTAEGKAKNRRVEFVKI